MRRGFYAFGAAMLRDWKWSNRRGTLVLSGSAVVSAIRA
jgi:hypothetical protein